MANRGWADETKRRALEIAEKRSIPEASAETGVPAGTIKRWRSEEKGLAGALPPASQNARGAKVVPLRKAGRRTEPNRTVRKEPSEPGHTPAPEEGRPIGRPSKLTPELQERLVALIRAGNYVETAVLLVGLSKQTFYEWLRKGREQKRGKYAAFADAIERAAAEADERDLRRIDEAADKGIWQAAAWRLERRRPDQFGRGGQAPPVDPAATPTIPDEVYEEIAAGVAAKILGILDEVDPDAAAHVRDRLGRKPESAAGGQVS